MDLLKSLRKNLRARTRKVDSLLKRPRISSTYKSRSAATETLESRDLLTAVSGFVFDDINLNGAFDANEAGMENVQVYLDANNNQTFDAGEATTETGADGSYRFENIAAGDLVVRQVVPAGFEQTNPTAENRLFGLTLYGAEGIQEIDPNSGAVVNQFPFPTATYQPSVNGLAFDGDSLFLFNQTNRTLYKMDPYTGSVLQTADLSSPFGGWPVTGMAAMNGKLYFLSSPSNANTDALFEFDANTLQLESQISFGRRDIEGGIAPLPGENLLVVATNQNQFDFIDPTTGLVVDSVPFTASSGNNTVTGLAVIGNEIYLTAGTTTTDVFARDGSYIRSFTGPIESQGLAGGVSADSGYHIDGTTSLTGLNFGNRSLGGTIAGVKFEDWNGNGVQDQGEDPLAGVTIYLDQNQRSTRFRRGFGRYWG